jgi:hypothetical protein
MRDNQFQELASLLLVTKNAERKGSKLVITKNGDEMNGH